MPVLESGLFASGKYGRFFALLPFLGWYVSVGMKTQEVFRIRLRMIRQYALNPYGGKAYPDFRGRIALPPVRICRKEADSTGLKREKIRVVVFLN